MRRERERPFLINALAPQIYTQNKMNNNCSIREDLLIPHKFDKN